MEVRPASREESDLFSKSLGQFETKNIAVKSQGAVQVGNFQVHVADSHFSMQRTMSFILLHMVLALRPISGRRYRQFTFAAPGIAINTILESAIATAPAGVWCRDIGGSASQKTSPDAVSANAIIVSAVKLSARPIIAEVFTFGCRYNAIADESLLYSQFETHLTLM